MDFVYCDDLVDQFLSSIKTPIVNKSDKYYVGVDLGTACVVSAVLNENGIPVAGAYQYANVVKDGMVVDYVGAINIVRTMKQKLEEQLDTELNFAAAAIPPGTDGIDGGVVKNAVEGAGYEVNALLDEPSAANEVVKIKDGVIVDIGGGTTGISVIKDGRVVYVADEPTGGTHFSLVVAGAYKMPYEEAELFKRDEKNHKVLLGVLKPVVEKISSIVTRHVQEYDVKELLLVGGTASLAGIEDIITQRTGIPTYKPKNPMFVTPLGIALSCVKGDA